ncbi:MAG: prepilin-type N-terminal cleavage/methylation domain-containing protein [Gudongella sp.]|nr:prepilin-type N-terminal cleavage/methylation domain-containing protein [Gudongella sp.]
MRLFSIKRNKTGFTLIELIVVIAVLGILAAIAIPRFSGSTKSAKIKVDTANLSTLNKSTQLYAVKNNASTEDIFKGVTSDTDRMEVLITNALLTEVIIPLQDKVKFKWNIGDQIWTLGPDSILYGSAGINMQELLKSPLQTHTWNKNGSDGIKSTYGTIFTKNENEDYTITSKAILGTGTNGGYGIFFETSVDENTEIDTGYILQFDRGRGSIIIKERGSDPVTGAQTEKNSAYSNAETKVLLEKDDPWWTSTHDIQLDVSTVSGNDKKLSISIDGTKTGEDFFFTSTTSAMSNYTGFRAWGNESNFSSLEIQEN